MKPKSHLGQGIRSEEGFSLFVVMTAIVLLTALAVIGYDLAIYTSKDTTRARVKNSAFQAANSGADAVLASWGQTTDTSGSGTVGSNSYVWSYGTPTVLSAYNQYTLEVTGTANQGNTAATSHVTVTFSALALWDMNIGVGAGNGTAASSGNSSFQGNSTISGPFYIKGDFEMGTSNNSSYDGGPSAQRGPLFVRGDITEFGGGTTGNFDLFCNGTIEGLSSLTNVTLYRDVPNLQLPAIGVDSLWLQRAQDQSTDGILGNATSTANAWESGSGDGSTPAVGASQPNYKVVNGSLTLGDGTAAWGRYPAAVDADTQPHGDFAYDGAGNLYVEGDVYITGNLVVSRPITYRGSGVLYVKGTSVYGSPAFSATAFFLPPGTATVAVGQRTETVGTALPSAIVGIVSPRFSADSNDPAMLVDAVVHAPIFSQGILSVAHNSTFYGACLSYGLQVGDGAGSNAGIVMDGSLFSMLPASIPGKGGYIVALQSWRRPK